MAAQAEFEGRTILVTGGTTGIGRAVGEAFHARGASICAAGLIKPDAPRPVRENWREMHLDVTDEGAIGALVKQLDRVDVLVNCAGVIARRDEYQLSTFSHIVDVNLTAVMRMCMAARPLLARQQGCIVNIASMLSFFGSASAPGYSASKGGVVQLTKSLAIELAGDGIRVNAVAPGWISTEMTAPLENAPDKSDPILHRTPMKRWGRPEEVAYAVLALAVPAASFITGAVLTVDGGYSIQ